MRGTRTTPARRALRGLLLAAVGGALYLAGGCGSLPKDALAARLAALPKNAGIGPLERRALRVDLGAGPRDLELTWLHRAGAADPALRPVVLVHGTPATLYTWSALLSGADGEPGLDPRREVYALEVLGHGVEPGPVAESFDACARYVVASLRALGLERAHLVGQSYGGEFVWRAALDAPELVTSVTLMNASGLERRDEDWLDEERVMRANPLAGFGWLLNSRARITAALAPHYQGELPPDRVEEVYLVCRNETNWRTMIALARDENGTRQAELARLARPVLLLWGADDVAYPPETYARGFAAALPDARVELLERTGHYPQEERPVRVARALERFWADVEAAR
ncbi:MAG: alpha/beta fold hydrolase [Planctomycetes bacterium]|nr:alpha/beta fold hydrolase [Planctomycetota bacterium]